VDPVSLAQLLGSWRLDALVLVVLGLALTGYVNGVRALARHGLPWPVARTSAFVGGLLVALVDLCSGVATYAPALVSVQLGQLLVALLAVPALLAAGAPLTLWGLTSTVRGRGRCPSARLERAIRCASSPVVGAALVSALLLGLYRTPLIELSLRSLWVHLIVLALAMVAGGVLWWPVLGIDPVPDPRGLAERAACVTAVVACLLLLGAQLGLGDRLMAGDWFLELRWGWADPVADQRLGGLLAMVAAASTAAVMLVAVGRARHGASATAQRVSGQTLVTTGPSRS
jgi:putative copper resistance protein D